jgi:Na+/H+ antiporter NhaD/arsenite permease-like protein
LLCFIAHLFQVLLSEIGAIVLLFFGVYILSTLDIMTPISVILLIISIILLFVFVHKKIDSVFDCNKSKHKEEKLNYKKLSIAIVVGLLIAYFTLQSSEFNQKDRVESVSEENKISNILKSIKDRD